MDDLRIYAGNGNDFIFLLETVNIFGDDIGIELNLIPAKWAKATFKTGKFVKSSNIVLDRNAFFRNLQDKVYKYLGIQEGKWHTMAYNTLKWRNIKKQRYCRLRLVPNRIDAINSLAIPDITDIFDVMKWNFSDIERVDSKIG